MDWTILQSSPDAGVTLPIEIVVAVLGIVVTVLTVYGAFIKYLYDGHTTLDQLLRGANGDKGFIQETQEAHADVSRGQREIERTLRAHGALLQELVFTLHRVAENMEKDDMDDLDIRRLEHLEETLRSQDTVVQDAPDYDKERQPDGGQKQDAEAESD